MSTSHLCGQHCARSGMRQAFRSVANQACPWNRLTGELKFGHLITAL
jgi:hypothetical protein